MLKQQSERRSLKSAEGLAARIAVIPIEGTAGPTGFSFSIAERAVIDPPRAAAKWTLPVPGRGILKPLYRSVISLTVFGLAVLCILNVAAVCVLIAVAAGGNQGLPAAIGRRAPWTTDMGIGLSILGAPAVAFLFSVVWYPFARRRGSRRDIAYSAWALILATLGLIFIFVLLVLPACRRPPDRPHLASKSNLRQIGLAILMYQSDYGDRMPPDFQTLHEERYAMDPSLFRDPRLRTQGFDEDRIDATCDYVWSPVEVSDETKDHAYSSGVPIAWEKRTRHKEKCVNALFADGHVDYMPVGTLKALTKSAADVYKKPPILPEGLEQ